MRVLVAEDHERLARAVAAGLRRYGMVVDVALDGDDALARLGASRYDVVVLDRDLPGTHGDEICRTLAAGRSESRVLMLTAASSVRDRVEGLGLAPTTTCPSRSTSPRWSPGSRRSAADPALRSPNTWATAT